MVRQGDIVWLNFDPQSGHEQKGRRPALVVSNAVFHSITKTTAMVCPITKTDKNSPIRIRLDSRTITAGVIMCDQAKIFDVASRDASFIEKAPVDIVAEVIDIISGIIEMI
jgi:mRNA interferase MazF